MPPARAWGLLLDAAEGRHTRGPYDHSFEGLVAGAFGAPSVIQRRMEFLVVTRRYTERFSEATFAEQLGPEGERARELYAQGHFRSINSRGDVPGAIIRLEASDAAEAAAIVGTLPLAQHGMMEVTIIPVTPYRAFVGG